jgi:hypothetical protein
MLKNIRADHQVVLTEFGNRFPIDVNRSEISSPQLRQEKVVLIGEDHGTATFKQSRAKNPMPTTQIEHLHSSSELDSPALNPADRVFCLKPVKLRIVPVSQMVEDEFVNDHCLSRKESGVTVPSKSNVSQALELGPFQPLAWFPHAPKNQCAAARVSGRESFNHPWKRVARDPFRDTRQRAWPWDFLSLGRHLEDVSSQSMTPQTASLVWRKRVPPVIAVFSRSI